MQKIAAKSLLLFVFGFVLLLSTAAAVDFQKSYTIGAGGRIRVQNVSGNIVVTGYDGNTIMVTATKEGRDRDQVTIEDRSTGDTVELLPGARDILLSLFYTRMLPIAEGNTVQIDNHTDRHNYPLEVRVLRREEMKTILGKVNCLVVEPVLRSAGLFEHKGRMFIWLTDDQRKIPVLLKSKVVVGSFKAVLKEYNPGMD